MSSELLLLLAGGHDVQEQAYESQPEATVQGLSLLMTMITQLLKHRPGSRYLQWLPKVCIFAADVRKGQLLKAWYARGQA